MKVSCHEGSMGIRGSIVKLITVVFFGVHVIYSCHLLFTFLWPQVECEVIGSSGKSSESVSLDPRVVPHTVCQMDHSEFNEHDFSRFTWSNSNQRKWSQQGKIRSMQGKELLLKFYQNQFCYPGSCKHHTLDLPSRIDGQGVGHRVIQEAHLLNLATGLDRILRVAHGGWKYCDKEICPAESSVCYFEPIHGCNIITSTDATKESNLLEDLFKNFLYFYRDNDHVFTYGNQMIGDSIKPCVSSAPPKGWEGNRFYWNSLATYFMSQPQQ